MRRLLLFACALAAVVCVRPVDAGVITAYAGDHQLLPNTITPIDIMVYGDAKVTGLSLQLQVGPSGDAGSAPHILNVDLITTPDLLFHFNNTGQANDQGAWLAFWAADVLTEMDPGPPRVATTVMPGPNGSVLARALIDTNGWKIGDKFGLFLLDATIDYPVSSAFGFAMDDFESEQFFVNGSIEIVPEPSTFLLMFAGVAGFGIVTLVRRKRSV